MSSLREFIKKTLKKSLIKEISEKFADVALDHESSFVGPFSKSIFGDNTRIIVPMTYEGGIFDVLRGHMDERGWKIDFEKGVASQEVQTKKGLKVRETRIVKAINKEVKEAQKQYDSMIDSLPSQRELFEELFSNSLKKMAPTLFAGWNSELQELVEEIYGRRASIFSILLLLVRNGGKVSHVISSRLLSKFDNGQLGELQKVADSDIRESLKKADTQESYIDTSKEKEFLDAARQYESHGAGYSIIFSRAPIDILRMSDWKHLQSCHSEPGTASNYSGDYFHCAVEESQTGGAIAYLVKTKDIEGEDLNAEEFFDDKTRGIAGVRPIARLRLRRFSISGENDFLASELESYGTDFSAFFHSVSKELDKLQKPAFESLGYKDGNYPSQEELEMVGGSYTDTAPYRMLNNYFKDEVYSHVSSKQSAEDIMEQWADEVRRRVYNRPMVDYSHDLEYEEYEFSWHVRIHIDGLEEWWEEDGEGAEKFWWDAEEAMPGLDHVEYHAAPWGRGIDVRFHSVEHDMNYLEMRVNASMDEFDSLCEWLEEWEGRLEEATRSDEEGEMLNLLNTFEKKTGSKVFFRYGDKIRIKGPEFDATAMFQSIDEASQFFSYVGNPSYYDTNEPRKSLRRVHKASQYKLAKIGGGGKIKFIPVIVLEDDFEEGEGAQELGAILNNLPELMNPEFYMLEMQKKVADWRSSNEEA